MEKDSERDNCPNIKQIHLVLGLGGSHLNKNLSEEEEEEEEWSLVGEVRQDIEW